MKIGIIQIVVVVYRWLSCMLHSAHIYFTIIFAQLNHWACEQCLWIYGNATAWCWMVPIIIVNRTGRSVNMIQHKRVASRRQTFIEHSYIYIDASVIHAAVEVSYHMKYSGTGLSKTLLTLDTSSSTNAA